MGRLQVTHMVGGPLGRLRDTQMVGGPMGRLQVTNVLAGGPSGKNIYSRPYARALHQQYLSLKNQCIKQTF